jgi:hypothetical protein
MPRAKPQIVEQPFKVQEQALSETKRDLGGKRCMAPSNTQMKHMPCRNSVSLTMAISAVKVSR